MIEQRMGSPNLSPEEKQSLNSMLQNVTEEYSALRAIYPDVAIPTPNEQQPPMGYPNAQGSSMPVYVMPLKWRLNRKPPSPSCRSWRTKPSLKRCQRRRETSWTTSSTRGKRA